MDPPPCDVRADTCDVVTLVALETEERVVVLDLAVLVLRPEVERVVGEWRVDGDWWEFLGEGRRSGASSRMNGGGACKYRCN